MTYEISLAEDVGFRHLLEDGISLLKGEAVAPDRRNYVLTDLASFLLEAKRGFEFMRTNALFVASSDRIAYERFRVLDRYLGHKDDTEWSNTLDAVQTALTELREKGAASENVRPAAEKLLQALLESANRDGGSGIPGSPTSIEI